MKRAVIIGGCGFIGSHVVRELVTQGVPTLVIDNLSAGKREAIDQAIPFLQADIRDFDAICDVVEEGDVIFHLAALTSVPESFEDPLAYHETNIRGTYTVFEAARRKKASGIVFSSSAAVYGNQEGVMSEDTQAQPESPYAFQKRFGEQLGLHYASAFGLPFVALRYFNVYGKGNHEEGSYAPVTARFLKAKRDGRPLPIVGDGTQTRDFIHVEDVARANALAMQLLEKQQSEIINICSGKQAVILDIADMVGGEKEFLPPRQEIRTSCGNPKKALKLLGFSPSIPLEKGLADLLG